MIQIIPRNPSPQELGLAQMGQNLSQIVARAQQNQMDINAAQGFTSMGMPEVQQFVRAGMRPDVAFEFAKSMRAAQTQKDQFSQDFSLRQREQDRADQEMRMRMQQYQMDNDIANTLGGGRNGANNGAGNGGGGGNSGYPTTSSSMPQQQQGMKNAPSPQQNQPQQQPNQSDVAPIDRLTERQKNYLMIYQPEKYKMLLEQKDLYGTDKKQAEADQTYGESLEKEKMLNDRKEVAIKRLEDLNNQNASGHTLENFYEKYGFDNQLSPERVQMRSEVDKFIDEAKKIYPRLTTEQVNDFRKGLPNQTFTKEQNQALIDNLKNDVDLKKQEYNIMQSLKNPTTGKLPKGAQSIVNQRLQQYIQSKYSNSQSSTQGTVRMIAPDGGEIFVPPDQVERAASLGARR